MDSGLDEIARAELIEREPFPRCGAPPGSVCRAHSGVVAVDYRTGRYGKTPALKSGPRSVSPPHAGPAAPGSPAPNPTSTPNSSRGPATASATPASPARAKTSPDRSAS
ncbi:hypothetical protein [Streptomyces sp. NBC_00273]|uniref:hypothetical protein n=1 Tax=Streptomyces sp. NBC_00273 TaxID=2903644 RepID=UPI002E2D6344|nr:hypothetical protein [Streptomyces sp. NBC_00273]